MCGPTSADEPRRCQPEVPADDEESDMTSYDGAGYLKAELEYRSQRIQATTRGSRRRHVRIPLVRRPADATS